MIRLSGDLFHDTSIHNGTNFSKVLTNRRRLSLGLDELVVVAFVVAGDPIEVVVARQTSATIPNLPQINKHMKEESQVKYDGSHIDPTSRPDDV